MTTGPLHKITDEQVLSTSTEIKNQMEVLFRSTSKSVNQSTLKTTFQPPQACVSASLEHRAL